MALDVDHELIDTAQVGQGSGEAGQESGVRRSAVADGCHPGQRFRFCAGQPEPYRLGIALPVVAVAGAIRQGGESGEVRPVHEIIAQRPSKNRRAAARHRDEWRAERR